MLKRLWKRFVCRLHGHDLELKSYDIEGIKFGKVWYLKCKHCGKVVIK